MPPAAGPERILVLHPGALGDVMQAVPALRAVGRLGPVTLAGQGRLATFLRDAGAVADARVFDTLGLEALFTADLPAPPALAPFSTIVAWFGSTDPTFGDRLRRHVPRAVIASPAGDAAGARPVWRWLLDTVAPLGIAAERGPAHGAPPGVTPAGAPEPGGRLGTMPVAPPAGVEPLALPAEWRERARRVLADAGGRGGPTLIVHPGAGGAWKRWAAERFADVVARVVEATGARPIVHQGPADAEPAARLHGLLEGRAGRLVEPDLPVLAGALGEAAGYLGGDSGVSQLAAAVGAAAVVVYPEGTRARWAPWCETALAVTGDGDPGRPAEVARLVIDRISGRPGATSSAWR